MFKIWKLCTKKKFLIFMIIIFNIVLTTIKSLHNNKDRKLFEPDRKEKGKVQSQINENSKITVGEKNKKQEFTEILPDDHSTPLRLSKEQIGRYTWSVLHSIAAAYPVEPSREHKDSISGLLNNLAVLFPCKICSDHFKELLGKNPIRNNSREELVEYMCDIHNQVNKRLNKPIFDCSKAFEFWGGDCGCSGNGKNEKKTNNSPGENPQEATIIVENISSFERRK